MVVVVVVVVVRSEYLCMVVKQELHRCEVEVC